MGAPQETANGNAARGAQPADAARPLAAARPYKEPQWPVQCEQVLARAITLGPGLWLFYSSTVLPLSRSPALPL